jgi:hypothetical protein
MLVGAGRQPAFAGLVAGQHGRLPADVANRRHRLVGELLRHALQIALRMIEVARQ